MFVVSVVYLLFLSREREILSLLVHSLSLQMTT
jgi:hypothetical protein